MAEEKVADAPNSEGAGFAARCRGNKLPKSRGGKVLNGGNSKGETPKDGGTGGGRGKGPFTIPASS